MNENSDTWVVKQLGEELMPEFRRLMKEEQLGWTQTMNRQMRSLWEKGVSTYTAVRQGVACCTAFCALYSTLYWVIGHIIFTCVCESHRASFRYFVG